MKFLCLFAGLSLVAATAAHSQTTTVTVDANNVMNSSNTNLNIVSGAGQSFFVGRQAGSGYVNSLGIFRAMTDNPYGDRNWFYEGLRNGTQMFSVRADGNMKLGPGPQGYYSPNYSVFSLSNAGTDPSTGGVVDFYKGNSIIGLLFGDGAGMTIRSHVGSGIHFTSPSQEMMTINNNGNVSVNNGNLFFAYGQSYLSSDQYGSIELGSSTASSSYPYLDMHFGGQSAQQDFNVRLMNNDNNQLQFQTAANGTVMTIRGPRVGIGTAQPDAALAVNGIIHAQQVKVDMTGWNDAVFYPSYRLRPLSEIKAYVDKYHHLPEVPSEAEVIKNGQNVGEMNRVLLKKIEELTLHVIRQNLEIQLLKNRINKNFNIKKK